MYDLMSALPPEVSVAEAEAVAQAGWGIAGAASELSGERDRNFRLRAADGTSYVLKFANPAEEAGFRLMQIAALEHIAARDPGVPVPRIVHRPDGAVECEVPHASGVVLRARLLTWLDGVPLGHARAGVTQREAFGAMSARLQYALEGFAHPGSAHEVPWDLQWAPLLRGIVHAIPDAAAQRVVHGVIDAFEATVVPLMPRLRRQVVHNDLNQFNMLVDAADPLRMAGVIDFGDLAETACIFDVAIAGVTQPGEDLGREEAVGAFLRGFHAAKPLAAQEIALVPLLLAIRVCTGLSLSCWHRHNQPDNPHFDVSPAAIARRLDAIAAWQAPGLAERLAAAIGA
jgi:Ser/Thr protein kinase RdoA (MazF antagonist)